MKIYVTLFFVAALSACGGGGPEPTPAPVALTSQQQKAAVLGASKAVPSKIVKADDLLLRN